MTRKPYPQKTPAQSGPRVNEAIRVSKVRLVDEEGEMIGVVSIQEALERAKEASLDLIEISPNSEPPVCKLMDYGKYKYQEQKRLASARKKQKIIEVKEIKIRPAIDENDYQVKLRAMQRFLEDGDKAKVTMRFRGREIANQELAMKLMNRIVGDLEDLAKIELAPKMEGRQMIMILIAK